MDTNSNALLEKKVTSIEVFHDEDIGYGPRGEHTRKEWRKECLENLLAGRDRFLQWQNSWKYHIKNDLKNKSFAVKLNLSDGSSKNILDSITSKKNPFALDFVGCIFDLETTFSDYEFIQVLLFSGVTFKDEILFNRVKFFEDIYLNDTTFYNIASFSDASFYGEAYLSNVVFCNLANFTKAKFFRSANFNAAFFASDAFFRDAKFHGSIVLINFSESKFKNIADFSSVEFSTVVDFSFAQVDGEGDFKKSIFLETAHFGGIVFNDHVYFEGANFKGKANFEEAEFHRNCSFKYVIFEKFSYFKYVKFDNVGHFENTIYKTRFPRFLGCKIDTTRLEFSENCEFPKSDLDEDVLANISFLKRLADEHGQTDQALMFNAFELNAKAMQPNSYWGIKIITGVYNYVSDYGRSFQRPLVIYVWLLFFTFLIALEHSAYNAPRNYIQVGCEKYVWWIERVSWIEDTKCLKNTNVNKPDEKKDETIKPHVNGIRAAAEYTLYRAAGVLDFADSDKQTIAVAERLFGQPIEPWWMRIWGIFKAIASTALLFLAALGLRNKYRIK